MKIKIYNEWKHLDNKSGWFETLTFEYDYGTFVLRILNIEIKITW